jgi:hypothetical protein
VLTNLDAQISPKFYTYNATSGAYTTKTLATTLTGNNDLKAYASGVAQSGSDNTIATLLCESTATSGNSGNANVTMNASATATANGSCNSTSIEIK